MNYDMTSPCLHCPFRTDCLGEWLGEDRATVIAKSLFDQQLTFPCHTTTDFDDDGDPLHHEGEQHCAGVLILLEKLKRPNQMMRIAERLGMYDHTKLNVDAPVFNTAEEFIDHHT